MRDDRDCSDDHYVYSIAGGEALKMIEYVKYQARQALKDLEQFINGMGGTLRMIDGDPEFNFAGPTPRGWDKWEFGVNGDDVMFSPDHNTPEGQEIQEKITALTEKIDIQKSFDKICQEMAPGFYKSSSYEFHEYGEYTIVKSPLSEWDDESNDVYYIPQDSKPISFGDYMKIKQDWEKQNETQETSRRVIRVFDRKPPGP